MNIRKRTGFCKLDIEVFVGSLFYPGGYIFCESFFNLLLTAVQPRNFGKSGDDAVTCEKFLRVRSGIDQLLDYFRYSIIFLSLSISVKASVIAPPDALA
jgi:hypothetical protein